MNWAVLKTAGFILGLLATISVVVAVVYFYLQVKYRLTGPELSRKYKRNSVLFGIIGVCVFFIIFIVGILLIAVLRL